MLALLPPFTHLATIDNETRDLVAWSRVGVVIIGVFGLVYFQFCYFLLQLRDFLVPNQLFRVLTNAGPTPELFLCQYFVSSYQLVEVLIN